MRNVEGGLQTPSRQRGGAVWPVEPRHDIRPAGRLISSPLDRWALERVRQFVAGAPIRFELWDGFAAGPAPSAAVATIRFKSRSALLAWLWDPELNFGESFMFGAIEIGGDLLALLEAIYRYFQPPALRFPWPVERRNDRDAARSNVHHHYDLGNAFYRLWLDEEMLYTCAYFPMPDVPLEAAQVAKMDLVCRKLRIQPGEQVIEAGCGWGSLALYMARKYGAHVRAFNISAEQIAYARERAAREGMTDRVEFVEDDYRNISGACDVFVSVGMLEHVGKPDYPTFGRVLDRTLRRDGRALLHFIGRNQPQPLNAWIRKRIFPGAYPPTLREVFEDILEPHAFSVLDVENLRLHYARTLEHWRRRFEQSADTVRRMFDDPFVRAWTLYLAGSQAAFTTGSLQLFQVVLARGSSNALPWTRVSG